ncbi:MAG: 50S ribosomal protein L22 [Candidatus Diapherotrites archaeon]
MVKKSYQAGVRDEKNVAKAILKNQRASLKFSSEIAREIKGKRLDKSVKFMEDIVAKKRHLPIRVFKKGVPHRKGDAKSYTPAGRYPVGAANVFLKLLETVKANADYKGLDAENLIITHILASQGFQRISFQSQGKISGKRRKRKSVHLEIIVREAK